MNPLVIGGFFLAREAVKWLSQNEPGSQQPQEPQIDTFPALPILSFGGATDLAADSSGIYTIHPIRLIKSTVEKLRLKYGAIDHFSVIIAECNQSMNGPRLQLAQDIKPFFEIDLKDLIEGEQQKKTIAFRREHISSPVNQSSAIIIFNKHTNSIEGLSYANKSLIYGVSFHQLERMAALINRCYSFEVQELITQRLCQFYGVAGLERQYDLNPWDNKNIFWTSEDFINLRSLYSLNKKDIKYYRELVKTGHEQIDVLKDLLGYGAFETYEQGVLKVNFQVSYAPQCNVIGQIDKKGWPKHTQKVDPQLFSPILYKHKTSRQHETEDIFFQFNASSSMYPFIEHPMTFTVHYKSWNAPNYRWDIKISEDLHQMLLLDQLIIQTLQVLDKVIGINLTSDESSLLVDRLISMLYGDEYIQYAEALINNHFKIKKTLEQYSEQAISWALIVNTLMNPFSYFIKGSIALDELILLKSMVSDDFSREQIEFIIRTQAASKAEEAASYYLQTYKSLLDSKSYTTMLDHGTEVLIFKHKGLFRSFYVGISATHIFIYSKDMKIKYVFDMSSDYASYYKDGCMFKLMMNQGKKRVLWMDSMILGLVQNLICINRNGVPMSNSNMNVPNYQKSSNEGPGLFHTITNNKDLIEGLQIFRRHLDDFSCAKSLSLIISGGLGAFFNMTPSDINKITLQTYKFFKDLSQEDKNKIRKMLSHFDSLSNLNLLLQQGETLSDSSE